MKQFSSLFCFICLISLMAQSVAQSPSPKLNYWDTPDFNSGFLLRNKIKSIQVNSFQDQDLARFLNGTRYEYDEEGRLTRLVETQQADTARIHGYAYTDKGTLVSEVITDKVWNKHYKSWYRFNRMSKVYQEKSYELLRNNETMLLQTRQYVYNSDSLLVSIRVMENNQLAGIQKYKYDERGRVIQETFLDQQEKEEKNIQYVYNEQNQLTRITTEKGAQTTQYIYVYNNMGQPMEVQWRENGTLEGTVTYSYDEQGILTRMERSLKSGPDGNSVHVRLFEYEHYTQPSQALSTN